MRRDEMLSPLIDVSNYPLVNNSRELMALPWDLVKENKETEWWELRFRVRLHLSHGRLDERWGMAFVQKRPEYCSRGQWSLDMDGNCWEPEWLDRQDGFPRFYMCLDTACQEAKLWLCWRLFKVKVKVPLDLSATDR